MTRATIDLMTDYDLQNVSAQIVDVDNDASVKVDSRCKHQC